MQISIKTVVQLKKRLTKKPIMVLYSVLVLVLFSTVQCTKEDDTQPEFVEIMITGKIQKDNDLFELDVKDNILDDMSRILAFSMSLTDGGSVVYVGVGGETNLTNIAFKIRAVVCGAYGDSYTSNERIRNSINGGSEQSMIYLEMLIDQNIYSNANLQTYLVFQNGCSIIKQRDEQSISTAFVGEDEIVPYESRMASVDYSYSGYLYNLEETDSVYVQKLNVTFPLLNI